MSGQSYLLLLSGVPESFDHQRLLQIYHETVEIKAFKMLSHFDQQTGKKCKLGLMELFDPQDLSRAFARFVHDGSEVVSASIIAESQEEVKPFLKKDSILTITFPQKGPSKNNSSEVVDYREVVEKELNKCGEWSILNDWEDHLGNQNLTLSVPSSFVICNFFKDEPEELTAGHIKMSLTEDQIDTDQFKCLEKHSKMNEDRLQTYYMSVRSIMTEHLSKWIYKKEEARFKLQLAAEEDYSITFERTPEQNSKQTESDELSDISEQEVQENQEEPIFDQELVGAFDPLQFFHVGQFNQKIAEETRRGRYQSFETNTETSASLDQPTGSLVEFSELAKDCAEQFVILPEALFKQEEVFKRIGNLCEKEVKSEHKDSSQALKDSSGKLNHLLELQDMNTELKIIVLLLKLVKKIPKLNQVFFKTVTEKIDRNASQEGLLRSALKILKSKYRKYRRRDKKKTKKGKNCEGIEIEEGHSDTEETETVGLDAEGSEKFLKYVFESKKSHPNWSEQDLAYPLLEEDLLKVIDSLPDDWKSFIKDLREVHRGLIPVVHDSENNYDEKAIDKKQQFLREQTTNLKIQGFVGPSQFTTGFETQLPSAKIIEMKDGSNGQNVISKTSLDLSLSDCHRNLRNGFRSKEGNSSFQFIKVQDQPSELFISPFGRKKNQSNNRYRKTREGLIVLTESTEKNVEDTRNYSFNFGPFNSTLRSSLGTKPPSNPNTSPSKVPFSYTYSFFKKSLWTYSVTQ